jgi:mono/diheme cytochrome c family protein
MVRRRKQRQLAVKSYGNEMSPKLKYLLGIGGACLLTASDGAHAHDAKPRSTPAAGTARSAGGKIFGKWCSDCHSTAEGPGTMALQRKYQGARPSVLEQRADLSPAFVKLIVRHGMSFMPSFRKTEISDPDLALLADYLASSQGQQFRTTKQR